MAPATSTPFDSSELDAYNGAFWDLGFRWQWDPATYRALCSIAAEEERVRDYITSHHPHLLAAYDAGVLARLIVEHKMRRQAAVQQARAAGQRAELSCSGVLDA